MAEATPPPNPPAASLTTTNLIRPIASADLPALLALIQAIDLFQPAELEEMRAMLEEYLAAPAVTDQHWVVDVDAHGQLVGVAYYAPERMTSGTWNLYFIGVHPDRRREGRASRLLRYVEAALAARGERLLLVETAGDPALARARALYHKNGYEAEARIRDFYAAGQDKIVFRKALGVS